MTSLRTPTPGTVAGMTVDGPGFHVEPDALEAAAHGMADILRDQDASDLKDLPTTPDHYGTPDAHAAVVGFCDAWSVGIDTLCDRSRWMAHSLADAAQAYRDADRAVGASLVAEPAPEADVGRPLGPP